VNADFDPKDIGAIHPPVTEDPYLRRMDQRWNSSVERLMEHRLKSASRSSLPGKMPGVTVFFGIDHATGRFVMVMRGNNALVNEMDLDQRESISLLKKWVKPGPKLDLVLLLIAKDLDPATVGVRMAVKRWMGRVPAKCDMCEKPIGDAWVDGKTRMGPWANMCLPCHAKYGVGLGEGRGQMYDAKTLIKIQASQKDPLTALVKLARANPNMIPQLRPAIREARRLTAEDHDASRRASACFPKITMQKWANLTCFEKFAVMKRVADKATLIGRGLTKDAVRSGMGFMVYQIDKGANKSKFYEGLIVQENDGFRVIRRWGALTDSSKTGNIIGEKFDKDDRFLFQSIGAAKRELAVHFATRISHGYTDAYGPKHVTPDGHKLPMGEYPVGLDRQVGFGWGTQSVTKCIPALKSLAEQLQKAAKAIKDGDVTQVTTVAAPLQDAIKTIQQVIHADSTMGQKLLAAVMKPVRRLEGGPKFLPDMDGKRMRAELVTIINYISKQTSYCE